MACQYSRLSRYSRPTEPLVRRYNPQMDANSIRSLQLAAGHFNQGRIFEAESICRRLMQSHPDAVDPANLLALIRKKRGDAAEAERLMRSCLDRDPGRADICANLGNLLVAAGRHQEAETAYRDALRLDQSLRAARLGLGRLLNETGQSKKAEIEAHELIGRNADDVEAWAVLGVSLRNQGRYGESEAAWRKALEINPRYGVARHNLGALLAQLSRSEEALVQLDLAATAGVRGLEIDFNRASVLMALYRFAEAEQLLVSMVKTTPRATNAQVLLARLRFMLGKEDFLQELAAAVESYPGDAELRLGYSRVLRGADRFDAARSMLQDALQRQDADPRLLGELAGVHQDAGDFEQALECARQATQQLPDETEFSDILIDALTSLGRAREAMPLIEAARARNPLNQWYVAMEATAARLLGDSRYEKFYDYEKLVKSYTLAPPEGWSSIEHFHEALIPALEKRHRFEAAPLDQSLRLGTQTPRGLTGDPDPVIQAFLQMLVEPIAAYRKAMGSDPDHPLSSRNRGEAVLTGCWSVRLKQGGYHVNHVHSEGWISSAYYVEVPQEVEDTEAKNGWIKFGEPRFPVPGAVAEKFVQPVAGQLVLFPSYMWHGTTPILGGEPRLTIAFDVITRNGKT